MQLEFGDSDFGLVADNFPLYLVLFTTSTKNNTKKKEKLFIT